MTLTYTAENGDAFVETIVLTQDAYSASGDSQALSLNMGDSGDITFDVTSNSFVSDDFLAAVAAATGKGETVTYAIANSSDTAAIANATAAPQQLTQLISQTHQIVIVSKLLQLLLGVEALLRLSHLPSLTRLQLQQ